MNEFLRRVMEYIWSDRGMRSRRFQRASVPAAVQLLEHRRVLSAQAIVVTTLSDTETSGQTTLRDAITQANADAGNSDTITFDPTLFANSTPGTITLTQGALTISNSMTITGAGSNLLTINGDNASQIFIVDDGDISVSDQVTITGMTLTGGVANGNSSETENGGAIANLETLTLSDVVISGNSANSGGGVENSGTLVASNDTFSNNSAVAGDGGGVDNQGTMSSSNNTFSDNTASANGGGISNEPLNGLISTNDTFWGNTGVEGGGIANSGSLTTVNDTLAANFGDGGGVWNGTTVWNSLNTIVAGNLTASGSTTASDVDNSIETINATNTLIGDANSAGGIVGGVSGNIVGAATNTIFQTDGNGNPLLTNNGGIDLTIPLVTGSPAMNAGSALATLTAPISDTISTTFSVSSTTFLSVGDSLSVDGEIVTVTGVDSPDGQITVLRGQLGTSAATHSTNTQLFLATDERGMLRGNNDDLGASSSQAPVAINSPTEASVDENDSLTFSPGNSNGISLVDAELPSGTDSLTLSVSQGTISLGSSTGLSFLSGTDDSATMTLTGAVADLNAAMDGLVYTPTAGYYGTDTLNLSITDSDTNATASSSVSVTVIPSPPTISGPATVNVAENDTLSFTDSDAISLGDVNATAEQLTLSVNNGVLALSESSGLTVTGDGAGLMTITGAIDDVNSALATLTYTPTAGYEGTDSLSLSVTDSDTNATATSTVSVIIAQPPSISAPATASVSENDTLSFTDDNTISVEDVSGTSGQVTLSVNSGVLALGESSGLTVLGNGSDSVTITGAIDDINSALATLAYTPTTLYYGGDTLSLSFTDNETNASATANVSVTVIPLPPTISAPATVSVSENDTLSFADGNAISVADINGTSEQVALSVNNGALALGEFSGVTVVGDGSNSITMTGAIDDINSALATLTYAPTTLYYGADTLSLSVTDTDASTTATSNVSMTVAALPPTIAAPPAVSVSENDTLTFTDGNTISMGDINGSSEQVTLSVGNGALALGDFSGLAVTGDGSSSMTLSGSIDDINSALATLTYAPTTLYYGTDTLSLSVTDADTNATVTSSVLVTVSPLPPTISSPANVSVSENDSVQFTAADAISVTDINGTSEQMTLSVNNGTLSLGESLGVTQTGGGTDSMTILGSLNDINSAVATLSYTATSLYYGSDTLSLSVTDPDADTTAMSSVNLTVDALPPTISSPTTVAVAQNGSLSFTDGNAIQIADINGTSEQMSLAVNNGSLMLGESLGLTVTGNATDSLTMTGSLDIINSALATLSYTPTTPYYGSDTLSLAVTNFDSDATATSSVDVTVTPLPLSISSPATVNVSQDSTLSFTDENALNVTDTNSSPEEMTLSVNHGVLTFGDSLGLTVTGEGTGNVTISGSLDDINSALATLSYAPIASYYGRDTLSLSVTDSDSNATTASSVNLTVTPLPPMISSPATVNVAQDGSLSFADGNAISVTDINGTSEQMTLAVSNGVLTLGESLGLTVTGDATELLTITGSVDSINSALATLTYTPATLSYGSDTLSLSVTDSDSNATATSTVGVTVAPLPPTVSSPTTVTVSENDSLSLSGANAISIGDINGTSEQMTITVNHGVLTFGESLGLTVTGNGTESVTVSGSIDDVNSALATLTYTPTALYYGSDTLNISVTDTDASATATSSVAVTVAALPPVISSPESVSVTQNASVSFTEANAISLADTNDSSEQLTLSVGHGTLTISEAHGLVLTGNDTDSVSLTGSITAMNAALLTLTYAPATDYFGTDTITLAVTDSASHATATSSIAVSMIELPPSISAPVSINVLPNGSLAFTNGDQIGLTDINGTSESVSLSVNYGVLTVTTAEGLTVAGNGTGVMTITGSISVVNAALASLVYTPAPGYRGNDTLSISDINTENDLSISTNVAINVAAPPAISLPTSLVLNENTTATFQGNLAICVKDQGGTTERLTLSVEHGVLKLNSASGLSIVGRGTGTISLTGTVANINAALTTLSYTPTQGYAGSDTMVSVLSSNLDPIGETASVGITVNATSPSIQAPTSVEVRSGGTLYFTNDNSINITDPQGSTEKLVIAVQHGSLTLGSTAGLSVFGNGSRAIIMSGTLAALDAALATLSYTPTAGFRGVDTLMLLDIDSTDDLRGASRVGFTVN